MAGKLGVFVELGLDDKVFKQKLSEQLQSTQATAKGIETSWKALGTTSAAVFDSQRRAAENAYTLIKNHAATTAADIVRAEEAKNAKIAALTHAQFGTQTSTIDKLKANWIAASVAIAAAIALASKAMQYMDKGAKALQVESSFKIMADSAGVNSERMIESMKAATRETIDDSDMMQKAVKLMTLGYDPDKIERFSKVVITASQIAGTSAAEAYDNLADAIANRAPKALVRMGAVTKEQMKIVSAAIEAGADSVVLYELAMANLELKQKMLQGTQDQATIAMQRFKAEASQTAESIGKGLLWFVKELYIGFQGLAVGGLYAAYGVAKFAEAASRAAQWADEKLGMTGAAERNKKAADSAMEVANNMKGAAEKITGSMKVLNGDASASNKKASAEEIANSKKVVDALMDKMKAYKNAAAGAAAINAINTAYAQWTKEVNALNPELQNQDRALQKLADDYTVLWQKMQKQGMSAAQFDTKFGPGADMAEAYIIQANNIKRAKEELRIFEEFRKDADAGNIADTLMIADAKRTALTDEINQTRALGDLKLKYALISPKEMLQIEMDTEKQLLQVARDRLQAEIDTLEPRKMFEEEGRKIAALSNQQLDITRQITNLEELRALKMKEYTGTAAEGFVTGLRKYGQSIGTEFQMWAKFAEDAAKQMEGSFSDLFFDAMQGKLKTAADYWNAFLGSIERMMADLLAKDLMSKIIGVDMKTGGASGGGILSWLASLGGSGATANPLGGTIPAGFTMDSAAAIPFHHGIRSVGETYAPASRNVSASLFASAPRLHKGLKPDEYPAILQRGERVTSRQDVAAEESAASPVGARSPVIVHMTVNAMDAGSFHGYVLQNKKAIADAVQSALGDNHNLRRSR
jgi:hypothetical protein